jgi:hypothetical protein
MKRLIAALGFMLLASPAFAGMVALSTPAVSVGSNVTCNATNVSTKTFDITIALDDANTNILSSKTFTAVASGVTVVLPTNSVLDTVRCVFLYSGSPKSVRADIVVGDSTAPMVALPAS